jgi:hypothetical protein
MSLCHNLHLLGCHRPFIAQSWPGMRLLFQDVPEYRSRATFPDWQLVVWAIQGACLLMCAAVHSFVQLRFLRLNQSSELHRKLECCDVYGVHAASVGFSIASVAEDGARGLIKNTNLVQEILDVLLVWCPQQNHDRNCSFWICSVIVTMITGREHWFLY